MSPPSLLSPVLGNSFFPAPVTACHSAMNAVAAAACNSDCEGRVTACLRPGKEKHDNDNVCVMSCPVDDRSLLMIMPYEWDEQNERNVGDNEDQDVRQHSCTE